MPRKVMRRAKSRAGDSDVQRPTVSPGGLSAEDRALLAKRDQLMQERRVREARANLGKVLESRRQKDMLSKRDALMNDRLQKADLLRRRDELMKKRRR